MQQLNIVGPGSVGVALLTASFIGMAFTIQVAPASLLRFNGLYDSENSDHIGIIG